MFDDLAPPGEDSRWDIFADFHEYLERRFPLVCVLQTLWRASHEYSIHLSHKHLLKNTTNLYALVYHWQGSDASLKPILLTAHQGLSDHYGVSTVTNRFCRCSASGSNHIRQLGESAFLRLL